MSSTNQCWDHLTLANTTGCNKKDIDVESIKVEVSKIINVKEKALPNKEDQATKV